MESTQNTIELQPIDGENAALKKIGEPYKLSDGSWSDGGTDTHNEHGLFRKDWTRRMGDSQNRRWLLQLALQRCVGVAQVVAITEAMIRNACAGDRQCAELVLKYAIGDPIAVEMNERMKVLEQAAGIKGAAPTDVKADEEAEKIVASLKLRTA